MENLKIIEDTEVIDTFKVSFEMEISNKVDFTNDSIVVYFKDGTKASVKTRSIQLKELL